MQIYFSFCFAWSWNIFLALSYWSVDKIEKCLLTLWSDVLVSSWCRRIWQHFLIPQLAVCPSRHCWPGNWPSGSSLSIRPLTNAIKGLLQTLPLPTTTKSFRFSNYTKFCQMSNLIWMIWMWCEHRRPGAGWEIEMLQLCWIEIHEICSVDAEAENVQAGEFWCKWHHWSGAGDATWDRRFLPKQQRRSSREVSCSNLNLQVLASVEICVGVKLMEQWKEWIQRGKAAAGADCATLSLRTQPFRGIFLVALCFSDLNLI